MTTAMAEPANRNAKDGLASLLSCPACLVSMRLVCRCPEMRGVLTTYECPRCQETETVLIGNARSSKDDDRLA
jgi:predicted RNA-binding Zn-ribbon protein involved in translation (DUF1610 family)